MTTPNNSELEKMAEQLHLWYLEATQKLDPENYNPKAQKSYAELNEQQKNIDRYIAEKTLALLHTETQRAVREDRLANAKFWKDKIGEMFDKEIATYEATINHKEEKS